MQLHLRHYKNMKTTFNHPWLDHMFPDLSDCNGKFAQKIHIQQVTKPVPMDAYKGQPSHANKQGHIQPVPAETYDNNRKYFERRANFSLCRNVMDARGNLQAKAL